MTWSHVIYSMKDYLNILLAICRAISLSPSKESKEDNMSGIIIGMASDLF